MVKYKKVRVRHSPQHNTWFLDFATPDGRRRRLSVGPDRHHAERQAFQFEEWLNQGLDPEQESFKHTPSRIGTLREIEPMYVRQHMSLCSEQYQQMHRDRWNKLSQCPQIVDVPMLKITKKVVRDYREARRLRDGVVNATLNRDTAKLQAILNWAVREEYLDRNPLQGLEKLKETEPRRVKLEPKEVHRLVQALPLMPGLIVQFAYYTGARKESILSLQKHQVCIYDIPHNGLQGHVNLLVKGGRNEILPLDHRAITVVHQALESRNVTPEDYIFSNPRTGTRYDRKLRVFYRCVRRLGILIDGTPLQFHDLRRNVGTQLRHGGAGRDDIQALLTHSDPGSVDRYFYDDRLLLGHLWSSIPSLEEENWQEIGKVEDTGIRKRTQDSSQVLY